MTIDGPTTRRGAPSLARLGLTDERAEGELRRLGWWTGGGPRTEDEPLLWALSRAPDPDLALRSLSRLHDATGWGELDGALRTDVELRGRLIGVLGCSTALGDHLAAGADRWRRLTGEPADPNTVLMAAVEATGGRAGVTGAAAVRALHAAYLDLLGQLAAADVAAVVEPQQPVLDLETVGARLSDLADAALRAALAVAVAEVGGDQSCRLAVVAMGKCGGRELNYVSDVDVVFVVEPDGEPDTQAAIVQGTKIASAMMRIAGAACFQVDAALRPEGKAGALVRTVESHRDYYRRWARTWEFQALLKARPAAGDPDVGQSYLDAVLPMVWTAADREGFVADVHSMRRRVEEHVPAERVERELKLGRGGLRDVEFAVQLLQLVHGRSDETLRVRSTVDALRALGGGGFVGREDSANLAASYEFLRLLEHRLQLQRLRRTHLLPAESDTASLRWLARAAGIGSDGRRDAVELLLAEVRRHAHRVRRIHEKLFYRPLLEAVAKVPTSALRLTPEAARARLAALGYTSPDGALNHLQALTSGVTRRAAIQTALLPVLLDMLADTPDPDRGLLAYRQVSEALATTPWYLRLLRDEGAVAERLMMLLGTSKYVPDLLVRAAEVLRLLGDDEALTQGGIGSLHGAVTRHADPVAAVATARSLRRHELLRIACADLLGMLDVRRVCSGLSAVWAAVLAATLEVACRVESRRRGGAPGAVAVIAMGRLGGGELGYGSDADVLFVCEPTGGATEHDALRYATAVAESVRGWLAAPSQDPPLQVDANLRPEGRNGPLVRTLASYRAYYGQWSQVWEAQALLRASILAGDADLGERFLEVVDPIRYPDGGLDQAKVTEIRRIKARVDAERLPRGADPNTHTKLGRGGLADIEWTLQLLQLRHGFEVPALRTTSTVDGLRAAVEAGLVAETDAAALDAAWTAVTKARNASTLVRGKPTDQLPRSGRELAAFARALGYPPGTDPGKAVDDYRRTTRRARTVVERLFYAH